MLNVEDAKIAVVGLGYVGLPLAVEFGKSMPVVGYDINARRIDELRAGNDRTLEVSEAELAEAAHLTFTADPQDIADCTVFIVTTPTPVNEHKQPDLSPVLSATDTIAKVLKPGDVVVYESTVYPGATEEECVPVLERVSGLRFNEDFFVGYSPERINPGDKEHRISSIVKVTSGSTPEAAAFVDALYRRIITAGTHLAPSIRVAEAAKVIENTQRDVNIALINELAILFNRLGIDTEDVLKAAGTKWNFLHFRPGLVGGHCIGVDPYYLTHKAQAVGYHPEIILAGRRLNDSMGAYVASQLVKRMTKEGIPVKGARVLVMGLTFKENTPDLRNTRVVDIIAELEDYGIAVDVHDPWADPDEARAHYGIDLVSEPDAGAYDAIVLAVAHREFRELGAEGARGWGRSGASLLYDLKYVFAGISVTLLILAGYVRVMAWAFDNQSYNIWGALVWVPLIGAVNGLLIWNASVRERDPWFTRVLLLGFLVKMVGTFGRYVVAFIVYRGAADASGYNAYAARFYKSWRQGEFVWEWTGKQGTQWMEIITTAVYTVIGPSTLAGFFVFASFAFWGAYLLYRAFRIALPGGDYRRYALLLFFLPSLLYWPSSIGKESWLFLFVGVTALGAAKFFTRDIVGGITLLLVGALGTALIRPHVSVLLFAALFVAQIVRPTVRRSTSLLTKAAGIFVMAVAAAILTTQTAQFLGIDDLSWQAISESVEWSSGQTEQGGSKFTPVPVTSIFGLPAAIVTLLFRPFPWEAGNLQMLAQSMEGIFLIVLTLTSWPRLMTLPRVLRRSPYVVFALVYALAFIVAFSGFGNLGILARQRVLMLPLFLVLLCLPKPGVAAPGTQSEPSRREFAGVAQGWQ